MTDLIKSVADLTRSRDREGLEITLASVMFDLIDPSTMTMWRIVNDQDKLRLRQRAGLSRENRIAISDMHVEVADLPQLDTYPHLKACFDGRAPLRARVEAAGLYRHVFPLLTERETIGLLEILHPEPLTEAQEKLVEGLLRIYRNHLAILDYSEHDELTGLLNRRTFASYFTKLVAREPLRPSDAGDFEWLGARRPFSSDQPPWLGVADIDFFKRINDTFGHTYGDEVLLLLSRLMRNGFRDTDGLFRFGGEEFVVVLGHAQAPFAAKAFERFRAAVAAFRFPQIEKVTVSIGFTQVLPGEEGAAAFGRADQALYVAKEQGRNQVRCYEELLTAGLVEQKKPPPSDIELF